MHTHTPHHIHADATITKDIRQYLGTRFTKNSVDSELQHQIRENLHMRVVPCKCVLTSFEMYLGSAKLPYPVMEYLDCIQMIIL